MPHPFNDCPPVPPFPAANGLSEKVKLPDLTLKDFDKVLLRARPTVSKDDLQVFTKFTSEFGEEGS